MPAGLLPNIGLPQLLKGLLTSPVSAPLPWELMFFVNDYTPTFNTVIEDLVEATWGGYSRLTLDPDEWTEPEAAGGCAHSTWGTVASVWFVTGAPIQTNYGLAYVDPSSNIVVFAQRFDAGDIEPVVVGGKVSVLPEFTLTSAEC